MRVRRSKPEIRVVPPPKFAVGGIYDGIVAKTRGYFVIFVNIGGEKNELLPGVSGLSVGDRVRVKIMAIKYDRILKRPYCELKFIKVLERTIDKKTEEPKK